jgi:hypothetical protein
MIDYDKIRQEVAIRHGFLIDKNDPSLVAITLNELVLQRYVEILIEKQAAHMKLLEGAQRQGIAEAKVTASRVITEAADYVSEKVNTAITAALDEAIIKIMGDLAETRRELLRARSSAVSAAALSVGCMVVTVGLVVFL